MMKMKITAAFIVILALFFNALAALKPEPAMAESAKAGKIAAVSTNSVHTGSSAVVANTKRSHQATKSITAGFSKTPAWRKKVVFLGLILINAAGAGKRP